MKQQCVSTVCLRLQMWLILGLCTLLPQAGWATWDEETFAQKKLSVYSFVPAQYPTDPSADTVIGVAHPYTVERMDTVLDIARYFDLGYNELTAAYPGVDPLVPPAGELWTLPTMWVLPRGAYRGVVVNIPEMRLYYFPPGSETEPPSVLTMPVGIGRVDWQTPEAKFTVRGKTINPTWVIPRGIRNERIRERGWREYRIPGGSPDNPLGKYRIELGLAGYAIHGTNNPWAAGRLTTHGCVRLYPEDIEQFFPLITIGTPGMFVYQPVKLGARQGRVYAEVHEDIYGFVPDLWTEAQRVVAQSGWTDLVDPLLLTQAVERRSGLPVDVTRANLSVPRNDMTVIDAQ